MERNNKVWISGTVETSLELTHEFDSEKLYKTKLKVFRQSGKYDIVNLFISELLLYNGINTLKVGMYVEAGGQLRSYNIIGADNRSHHEIMVFVSSINIFDKKENIEDSNKVHLYGYICKPPTYRVTPLGREITDIMVAVERTCDMKDYIPCITWGACAKYASKLKAGHQIRVFGRLQSREYFKRISPESESGETEVTYELSVISIEKK